MFRYKYLLLSVLLFAAGRCVAHPGLDEVRDGYALNGEVRIHYTEMGSGPLMLFIHGFPDIWYTWRQQMEAFSGDYRTVAMDLRGYNLSDAPDGVENYFYDNLIGDVLAVIHELGEERAIIVAHDWGAAIAWRLATLHPDVVQRLVICSVPHPKGLSREVRRRDAPLSYADRFMVKGAEANFPPEWLSGWVTDPKVREVYLEAFRRSDIRSMLNYYRANFRSSSEPGDAAASRNAIDWAPVHSPVLVIFGEADPYMPVNGLNNTWDFVDNDLRIDIIQNAGHFVQQDAPDKVTQSIRSWLAGGAANHLPDADRLQGVWKVDEISLLRADGGGTNTAPQPGLFIFTRDHYSIAWIPRPEPRQAFATPWTPTAEEKERAYGTILFNSGRYELDETTLTTRPILSKVPELSGGHAVYEYRLEKDVLWLTMVDEYAADGSRAPWVGNVSFPLKLTRVE